MRCKNLVVVGHRQFLRGGAMAAVGATVATASGGSAKASPANARVDYPSSRLASLSDLTVNEPLDIEYPDGGSPGALIKLGQAEEGGVGPDGDVVAFSTLCPHRGYFISYNGDDRTLNCPGHFSRFDVEAGGQQS